jgi:hypothetical protein
LVIDPVDSSNSEQITSSPHAGSRLPPFRFSVRSLMLMVTACCLLMGLMRWLPIAYLGALILLLLVVGAHVAGNAIGTRLRDGIPQPNRKRFSGMLIHPLEEQHYAPTTNLEGKWSLGWIIPMATISGAFVGMGGGWYWMHVTYGNELEWISIVVTLAAFGVLGGFGAFLISTFLRVLCIALFEALRHK